jgi:hypothetical protein
MTRNQVQRLMIVSTALGIALAACTRAEPARGTASSANETQPATGTAPAPSAPPAQAEPAQAAAPQVAPGQAPPLASSHGPLPGVAPQAGSEAGAAMPAGSAMPAGAMTPGSPSPHGELRWDAPAGWVQEAPSNGMRAAQYRLPAVAGDAEDGECVVFYFGPGQGGDAASNAARWARMFTKDDGGPADHKVSEEQLGSRKVTRVEAAGIYHPMAFGGQSSPPRPGYMMLGAIVPGGDANWFFRCAGPRKTIAASRGAFDALLKSIK